MKTGVFVMAIMVMCICPGSISEEKHLASEPKNGNCRFPKGKHGSVRTDGCIKSTCSHGKWRPKLRTDICCYKQQVHEPNTVLDTIISADNCTSTIIWCGAVGQLEFSHNSCSDPATKQQVEQLEMNLEQQIEEIKNVTADQTEMSLQMMKTLANLTQLMEKYSQEMATCATNTTATTTTPASPTSTTSMVTGFQWCYEGDCGPSYWGDHFRACYGRGQSPIDIRYRGATQYNPDTDLRFFNYDKVRFDQFGNTNGTLKNNGHTAQLDVITPLHGNVGVLTGGPLDANYQILHLNFHWGADDTRGSEHRIDGKQYPMEMHIVHKKMGVEVSEALKMTKGLAITGFFFEIGSSDNAAIEPLIKMFTDIIDPHTYVDMSGSTFKIIDLVAGVAPTEGEYRISRYGTYSGSLTTPGCNEVVKWINFVEPIKISSRQLAVFRKLKDADNHAIVDNFRPVQLLNGRYIRFYQR